MLVVLNMGIEFSNHPSDGDWIDSYDYMVVKGIEIDLITISQN